MTIVVPLTRGYVATIDANDAGIVGDYSWGVLITEHGNVYASARQRHGDRRLVLMHRLLMGFPKGEVDHEDGDGLNNRRSNLRVATRRQNACNRRKADGTISRFKGVSLTATGKWRAYIAPDGKQRHLGHFIDERDAARAYDEAAIELWGEFARTNFGAAS